MRRMSQKKILIMTVPFGGGHYATAAKIADLIHEQDKTIDLLILDVITDGWPWYARTTSKAYQNSTRSQGAFWFKLYYRLTDRFPAPLRWFASIAFNRYAKRKLLELQPDLIIATFPFLGHVGARARKAIGLRAPIVTVITDAGQVQGIWLCGKEDTILAATPDTVDYAKQRKLGGDRVAYIGFPVDKAFYELQPTTKARHALGLNEQTFTILVTSGGLGMSAYKVVRLVERLAKLTTPVQIICAAGKNEQLRAEYEAIDFPSHIQPLIVGYRDDMPLLMAASDIVVSKSGWLTINEAIAGQRPLFLFDAIPGHEEENARYVTSHNFGIFEPDPVAMFDRILAAAIQPDTLRPQCDALAKAYDPGARRKLANYFIGLLHQ